MSFENNFNNNSNHHRHANFDNKLNINNNHHHRVPHVQPDSSIDILVPSIKAISDSFKDMLTQFESLKRVNDSLASFNEAFGSFLFGMAVNDTTLQWKEPITERTIERHQEHVKRVNSLEATKAVHAQPTRASTSTTKRNHSSKAGTMDTNNQSSDRSNKRRKIAKEEKKPLVSARKFVSKVNIRKIIDRLPLEYREKAEPMRNMENVLKILKLHPTGLNIKDLTAATRMQQFVVTKCLNALTASKEVLKLNQEGRHSVYQLDPAKYPSEDR